MQVSRELKNSAKDFCAKYACEFDFDTFASRMEEFTFLRPNGGWIDGYKAFFARTYEKALASASEDLLHNLDGEAMLEDFEYMLIRPYLKECRPEIRHKPYAGMDRLARLEYLERLLGAAPANPVALYAKKYKSGELSISQMLRNARSALSRAWDDERYCIEIAGYIRVLEGAGESRSPILRLLFPFRGRREKRTAAQMRAMLVQTPAGREATYEKFLREAYRTFAGYERAKENLAKSAEHAREEMHRLRRMRGASYGIRAELS